MRSYTVLDLFAGIGGLSYGFESLSLDGNHPFRLACAVELDPVACDTFRVNLQKQGKDPSVVLQGNLQEGEVVESTVAKCGGSVDVIVGGPPCQSFSTIGSRSGPTRIRERFTQDNRDNLYLTYITLVKRLKPAFLVFENVKGVLTKKDDEGKHYIDRIVRAISDCGYDLTFKGVTTPFLVLNAADYGVPQTRERVIIIGNRLGVPNPVPHPTHSRGGLMPGTPPWVTLLDAIGDLPEVLPMVTMTGIPEGDQTKIAEANKTRFRGVETVAYHHERFTRHYQALPAQGRQFLDFIKPETIHELTAHVARGQQLSDIQLFERLPAGYTSKQVFYGQDPDLLALRNLIKYDMLSFKDKYRKQSWNQPSTTLFAHMQKDGNRFIHPDSRQARTLTVREAARLQSFPDDYEFTAVGNVRYKYIGNAVPPFLAREIARNLLGPLSEIDSRSE